MAARETCAELIERLRDLIGDPASPLPDATAPTWSDTQLQRALDSRREDVRYLELTPADTLSGGSIVYLEFYAPVGDWEEDAALYDNQGTLLETSAEDYQVGKWTFAADTSLPVLIVGKTFDLDAAAADVLEQWAAKVKLDFGFQAGNNGGQFSRQQKHAMLLEQARQCRGRARPVTITMHRGDVNGTALCGGSDRYARHGGRYHL
jgi:hypothetical protein